MPKKPSSVRKKIDSVLEKVRKALVRGNIRDTRHAIDQKIARDISFQDIFEVLENGYHEKAKDEFKEEFQDWNYAIRGKTFEGRELRVPIYFEDDIVLIVTAFELDKSGK